MNTDITTTKIQSNSIIDTIARAASDPACDVAKMQSLLNMQKDIMATQARADYNAAMSDCQSDMQTVVKRHTNNDNKSKFAKLDDIDAVARPVYTRYGFALSFSSDETQDGFVTMKCEVMHRGGHTTIHSKSGWRDDQGMKGGATKTRIQGSGSTGSYLRRYLTCEVFNIITGDMVREDNDGQTQGKFITPSQRQAIIDALGGPGERVSAFCAKHGIGDVGDLSADSFDKALAIAKRG